MSQYIKEILRLRRKPYAALMNKLGEDEIMSQLRHFRIADSGIMIPVTNWIMFYYIDAHGNFIDRGKLKHHIIARAVFDSMTSKNKVEIMFYIEGHENDWEDEND